MEAIDLNINKMETQAKLKEVEKPGLDNVQTGGSLELNLDEVDMGTKPRVLDLNIEDDEPGENLGNDNVKVIKISADSNTLNMINK